MKATIYLLWVALVFAADISTGWTAAREQEKPWTGTLADGTIINAEGLSRLLAEHQKWLDTNGRQGRRANLQGAWLNRADLQNADLSSANLQGAMLMAANLEGAKLTSANFRGSRLENASLKKAELWHADLQGADLSSSTLQGADLWNANLREARLWKANLGQARLASANLQKALFGSANLRQADLGAAKLQMASFYHADLQGADLWKADLEGVIFEIKPNNFPDIPSIGKAVNLSLLKYEELPHALVELREAFKKSGLRKQEREVTYAIKRSGYENAMQSGNVWTRIEVVAGRIFFELTCDWGMSPERPLLILLVLIGLFTVPYAHAISSDIYGKKKSDGIWKVWIAGRMRDDLGTDEPKVILDSLELPFVFKTGFYFSVLSAFHFGWRDLNVGNWIARMQPHEYRLQATGWPRFVSGLQSLISVYLLALAVLAYFGRPFESY